MVQTSKEKNGATEIDQVLGKRERERERGGELEKKVGSGLFGN
jgi:hypothetical protein